jgi:hypothetical protein
MRPTQFAWKAGKEGVLFEKKNQKAFARCVRRRCHPIGHAAAGNSQKFFGSFFQKELLSSRLTCRPAG